MLNHIDHPALKVSVENGIKFDNLKHLNIKNYTSWSDKAFEAFISCSFPSNIESLSLTSVNIFEDYGIMSVFKNLKIKDAKITSIHWYMVYIDNLIDYIDLLSKANTVWFDQWTFYAVSNIYREQWNFKKVEIKNLLFTKCSFNNIESLKETITQIGLDKKIEKITFDDNCTDIIRRSISEEVVI